MSRNSATPHRQSLVHEQWIETMRKIVHHPPSPDVTPLARQTAEFCADVLEHCGDSPELTEYLSQRTLRAFGDDA